ncbi:MAG: aspartate--ammonia ligase [Bacteroidales bacterium]|nr:aspartate--ammonia ligase [Bacteroidales bacterium]
MTKLILPKDYKSPLDLKSTERAIKFIKDNFQQTLSSTLRLRRVTAPIIVLKGTGINDDLNGYERPVSFPIKAMKEQTAEVVHSLAKWKRLMLKELGIDIEKGIYTDMNALRPDEELDNLHSIYVDQWDWEKAIRQENRNMFFLKQIVEQIYQSIRTTEYLVSVEFPQITPILPNNITFIHSEDLLQQYPDLTSEQREYEISKKHKAVFIIGIGHKLSNGKPHDGRAPDYDDWISKNEDGYYGLNGDIIFWNPVLDCVFEISSMGIRVDKEALLQQLSVSGTEDRLELLFHKKLVNEELPCSIGGGIGQSRLCMFLLRNAHIGEVQSCIWPEKMKKKCKEANIHLL